MPQTFSGAHLAICRTINRTCATVAQLVEQGIRNAQVCGSTPHGGSMRLIRVPGRFKGNPFIILKTILLISAALKAKTFPDFKHYELIYAKKGLSIIGLDGGINRLPL